MGHSYKMAGVPY